MILVGNRRGGAAECAAHLMNVVDNDHVQLHELRGFNADDLDGALHEAYGISRGTRCKKFLYSLSLSPPETEDVPIDVFEAAIEEIECQLGFTGQPRAVIFHEKKNRRHAHVLWSRINSITMTAIDPYQDKLTLEGFARNLFVQQEWDLPPGLRRKEDTNPFNYSHDEHQQAKRAKRDPKQLKQLFANCWQMSDSRGAFEQALREQGFVLARGDRRGFVAVDEAGEVYSLSRWVGVKVKEIRAKLRNADKLPSIEEALQRFAAWPADGNINSPADFQHQHEIQKLEAQREALVVSHRKEREAFENYQRSIRYDETKARSESLPRGIKAVWFKLSGRYKALRQELEDAAERCTARDRADYQSLIERQLREKRDLQQRLEQLQSEPEVISPFVETDSAQDLILPIDPDALSIKAKVNHDPVHILKILTDKEEDFTRNEIVRGLTKFITDPFAVRDAMDQVMESPELVKISAQGSGQPVYTTRSMLAVKAALLDSVQVLSQTKGSSIPPHIINAAINVKTKLWNPLMAFP